MPAPYAEPASSDAPRQLVHLALAKVATASVLVAANKLQIVSSGNGAPIALTGAFAVLAQLVFAALTAAQKVVLTGSVAADVTSAALTGQLQLELVDSVTGALVTPVIQSYTADATGVSASYTWELSPTLGAHTFSLQGKATGDGSLSVGTGHATLVAMILG